ncbi:MAG TPA: SpoIID/LytB domain-containing protein [Thermoanaerobaculia bacterium]
MRRLAFAVLALSISACSSTPPPAQRAPRAAPASASPNRLTPVATAARAIKEPRIRVGLLSDQPGVSFARVPDGYYVICDAGPAIIRRGFTVTAPLAGAPAHYGVQVTSVSDLTSVNAFVEKFQRDTGQHADVVFDPAAGAYRVIVGDFPDPGAAGSMKTDLGQRGYTGEMPVVRRASTATFDKVHKIVDDEGEESTLRGDSILILPVSSHTLTIAGQPYRGAARLFINPRGLLNVINELNLEDYLFGVVPAEMGPAIFDEIEALKSQAVAARTYAVRNMRNFATEGYDICPGPACQAYKGFSGENALSTQAVNDTAGLIITYGGKPIDALYTSTCGGETSDLGTMFPGRNEPYLKRARCVELDMVTLAGRADSGLLTEQEGSARLFAALAALPDQPATWAAGDVERAVLAAQRLTGARETDIPKPSSSRRGDVLRYLAAVMRIDDKARITTLPEDRRYFFPRTGTPDDQAYLAAAFLMKFGVLPAQDIDRIDLSAAMPHEELYALLSSWLREHSAVQDATGKILTLNGRAVTLKAEGKTQSFTLPAGIPIFRRLGDRLQEYANVPVMLGDRAFIYFGYDKRPVAMIVQGNLDGASFDRTSSFANWTRSYRADELVPVINRRNPIQQLIDIRPVTIDASQRVAELEVTAEGGRKFMLRGLPVRWSLNVPDNLFTYDKTKDPDGVDRYTFFGKGWGHGTGFCQVGSYGMAFRGAKFDEILKHYYTDVEITPMSSLTVNR